MKIGKASFSRALGRVLLCLALFAAMLGQNSGHLAAEAASHSSTGVMKASGGPHTDHPSPDGTPIDCGDYGCHFLAPVRAVLALQPLHHSLATAASDSRRGAELPRRDRPPRE